MRDWQTNGYKSDYESIAAFIEQVQARDMALLKEEYKDALEKARLTGRSPAATSSTPRWCPAASPRLRGGPSSPSTATSAPGRSTTATSGGRLRRRQLLRYLRRRRTSRHGIMRVAASTTGTFNSDTFA